MFNLQIHSGNFIIILNANKPITLNFRKKNVNAIDWNYMIFEVLISLTFVLGIVFLIVSVVKREEKDYKFYAALIGHSIFLIVSVFLLFFRI